MSAMSRGIEELITTLGTLAHDQQERALIACSIMALDEKYALSEKMAREPGLAEIIKQLMGRIERAFGRFSKLERKRVLDIACGSNSSKAPPSLFVDTPFGETQIESATRAYSAQFEPWFCRALLELGAMPVGIDRGDLEGEAFVHYNVDLGRAGTLDFLPSHSFDAVQDSRLFGSPEFIEQFPDEAARLQIAREIVQQERRLLKAGGIIIHSDAANVVHQKSFTAKTQRTQDF